MAIPRTAALHLPYPNPFNSSVDIGFSVGRSGMVRLEVFGIGGQKLESLVRGWLETGDYRARRNGAGAASGGYVIRLRADEYAEERKVLLVK